MVGRSQQRCAAKLKDRQIARKGRQRFKAGSAVSCTNGRGPKSKRGNFDPIPRSALVRRALGIVSYKAQAQQGPGSQEGVKDSPGPTSPQACQA